MPFLLYIAIAFVAVFSVAMEMDILGEPVRHIERATVTELPRAPAVTSPLATDERALPPDATKAVINPPGAYAKALAEKSSARGAAANCNVEACAAAYHSFTASDCTYQPLEGPRRLCDKGRPPNNTAAAAAAVAEKAEASASSIIAPEPDGKPTQATCHVEACAAAYHTFTASDCTFQPSDGPRRLCTK